MEVGRVGGFGGGKHVFVDCGVDGWGFHGEESLRARSTRPEDVVLPFLLCLLLVVYVVLLRSVEDKISRLESGR